MSPQEVGPLRYTPNSVGAEKKSVTVAITPTHPQHPRMLYFGPLEANICLIKDKTRWCHDIEDDRIRPQELHTPKDLEHS